MTEAELRHLLKPLFAQFAAADGDAEGKLLGYFIALSDLPAEAIREAIRRYICGEVAEHDSRYLPNSAQVAKLCRLIMAARKATTPPVLQLERFDAPPEPGMVVKMNEFRATLAKQADSIRHEGRRDWLERMGDRILRAP